MREGKNLDRENTQDDGDKSSQIVSVKGADVVSPR